jgi:hypothetical protein
MNRLPTYPNSTRVTSTLASWLSVLGVGQTPSPIRFGGNLILPEAALDQVSLDGPYHSRLRRDIGMSQTGGLSDIGQRFEEWRSITRHRTTRSVDPT